MSCVREARMPRIDLSEIRCRGTLSGLPIASAVAGNISGFKTHRRIRFRPSGRIGTATIVPEYDALKELGMAASLAVHIRGLGETSL